MQHESLENPLPYADPFDYSDTIRQNRGEQEHTACRVERLTRAEPEAAHTVTGYQW